MFETAQTTDGSPLDTDPNQPRIPHLYGGQGVLRHSRSFYVTQAQLQSRIYGPNRYGRGPYAHRLEALRRDDGELRTEVEEALFYDTWVDAQRIAVEVENGVVTLRGTLPSYEEVRYATDDAWEIAGVRGVRSELTVDANPS
jgi:osmotically-inducible protein OsmY